MAEFPLICCFQGDYGYKVLIVDDGDSIDEVAEKAASKLVGVVVPRPPAGSHLRVRIQGSNDYLPRNASVLAAGLSRMDPIQILPVTP
jgi:toluene monooxygenase system protein B